MRTKTILLAAIVCISLKTWAGPSPEEGKTIFSTRCAGCHNVHKVLTGPALANVHQRHSIDWIINFVHSSQSVIISGDKEAVALFEKFNRIPMPDHPDLTVDNIKSVVEYIKSESSGASKEKNVQAEVKKPSLILAGFITPGLILTYLVLLGLLITTILFAKKVKSLEREMVKRKSRE